LEDALMAQEFGPGEYRMRGGGLAEVFGRAYGKVWGCYQEAGGGDWYAGAWWEDSGKHDDGAFRLDLIGVRPMAADTPTESQIAAVWKDKAETRGREGAEARAQVAALTAETERLREALLWYSEHARQCRLVHSGGDDSRRLLAEDGGERARAALAPDAAQDGEA
jgi:hypothetical protein